MLRKAEALGVISLPGPLSPIHGFSHLKLRRDGVVHSLTSIQIYIIFFTCISREQKSSNE
jgi:hypothetical protein